MSRTALSDLDAFVAVAEARSFRGAATLRGVSPSALSEALRRLEAQLKVRLLNRTTRSVTPTEAGQRLLERLRPAIADMNAALGELGGDEGTVGGTLRLNVPTAVAELVLPPILAKFMAAHPAIRVEVSAENSFIDVLAAGFDAGIRYGERLEQDMIAVPIGPREQRFVAAAAPGYLARHGTPRHPRDLMEHKLIRQRFSSGVTPPWEFSKDGETFKIVGRGPMLANHVALQIAAAEAGQGIIYTFEGFLEASLRSGRLVPILDDWSERFPGPFLYYASRDQMPNALRALVDFIKEYSRTSRDEVG
jgi:DNA-binding transcriptional LysR family regulator